MVGDWDAWRVRRVLDNLLDNAFKYSPTGGKIVSAVGSERAGHAGARAALRVRDAGLGLPAADPATIREPFRRSYNVAERIAGSGLRLATVRQIVEQHGGTI